MIQQSYFRRNNIPSVEQNRTRRDIMKKIILLCLLMLLMTVPVYAAEVDDAKQVVSDLKEISYRFESGISYAKFNELYSDVYVKVRKFEDTYPNSELSKLAKEAVEPYGDARDVWKSTLSSRTDDFKSLDVLVHKKRLMEKYPGIGARVETIKINNSKLEVWSYRSTLSVLFEIGSERTKELEDKITAN